MTKSEFEFLNLPHVPRARCLDADWVAVHHTATDITKTWRRFGWVPIENKEIKNEKQ
jgi:hypothetical protein